MNKSNKSNQMNKSNKSNQMNKSNKSNQMLVFEERGKPEKNAEKNHSECSE